jgi:hypothetical protein
LLVRAVLRSRQSAALFLFFAVAAAMRRISRRRVKCGIFAPDKQPRRSAVGRPAEYKTRPGAAAFGIAGDNQGNTREVNAFVACQPPGA